MRIIRSLLAPAALAVASGIAMLPALTSAAPASAQPTCEGTTLVGAAGGGSVRIPTPADGVANFNCLLGLGNAGPPVARLQIALDHCNRHADVAIDGIYGPQTQTAVMELQMSLGLPQDGVFGPFTSSHMKWPVQGHPTICRKFLV
jgi:peptidoglycan hydrolase-like protein with peptidoglycan-binding domain